MHHTEATAQALAILRNGQNFQWYVVPILAFVCYAYFVEIKHRNWNAVVAGLGLYLVHWFFEILNAIIQHVAGHALWTVPTGTSYLIFVGVGIEISLMFALSGIAISKLLPDRPDEKLFGVNARWLHILSFSALYSIIEVFLVYETPVFVWIYDWWGAIPVAITVYIPFFMAAAYPYYWDRKRQITFLGIVAGVVAVEILVFGVILGWI